MWAAGPKTDDSGQQIFEKLFHGRFFSEFCQEPAEIKSPKKYFFSYFILMPELGYDHGHLRLISQYITYDNYGNFMFP